MKSIDGILAGDSNLGMKQSLGAAICKIIPRDTGVGVGIVSVYFLFGFCQNLFRNRRKSSTLEPNNILYFSDYQIIHSKLFVI